MMLEHGRLLEECLKLHSLCEAALKKGQVVKLHLLIIVISLLRNAQAFAKTKAL